MTPSRVYRQHHPHPSPRQSLCPAAAPTAQHQFDSVDQSQLLVQRRYAGVYGGAAVPALQRCRNGDSIAANARALCRRPSVRHRWPCECAKGMLAFSKRAGHAEGVR